MTGKKCKVYGRPIYHRRTQKHPPGRIGGRFLADEGAQGRPQPRRCNRALTVTTFLLL